MLMMDADSYTQWVEEVERPAPQTAFYIYSASESEVVSLDIAQGCR